MFTQRQLMTLALLLCCTLPACYEPAPDFPHEDALYCWQRAWSDDVRDAVAIAPEHADRLMVLVTEAETAPIAVDWSVLADTNLPLTFVLRYPRLSASEEHTQHVLDDLASAVNAAKLTGVAPAGVQLDFDSPTRLLPEYTALLKALRPELPEGLTLSITALPTWLDNPDFAPLVQMLDYYVLQVHSFERPESIDTPLVLCDTSRIPSYLEKAAAARVPYYIAFPTHGYEVAYTADGAFAGLVAEESESHGYPPGYQTREVRAEPTAIAESVGKLRTNPPPWYRGNVWFRMPVATDARNWTWPTLAAVMDGRAPTATFEAEVRHPEPGLAEIWLTATGEDTGPRTVEISMIVPQGSVVGYDTINGFTSISKSQPNALWLRGTFKKQDKTCLIAWFRMKNESAARDLKISTLETLP